MSNSRHKIHFYTNFYKIQIRDQHCLVRSGLLKLLDCLYSLVDDQKSMKIREEDIGVVTIFKVGGLVISAREAHQNFLPYYIQNCVKSTICF